MLQHRKVFGRVGTLAAILLVGALIASCGGRSKSAAKEGYAPTIRPSDFGGTIDNAYLPLVPGARSLYQATTSKGTERTVIEVTHDTKTIRGVTCVVVHDTVTVGGELKEDTFDWYAQDRSGNVWYLGEATRAVRNGELSPAGSWEAGVDGALPGIIMKADPRVGDAYRQEYYRGHAEDMGKVVRTGASASVPFRSLEGLLVTQDWTPLEPKVVEEKFYARGIGLVLETTVRGGSDRNELVSYQSGQKPG
jgi:hypothetical protein